ncbi:MAG: hypothetical protein OQJ99_00980 [Rhodospirillales bacterium]|nr:hypothetical protein [Rhodospirillales bacterium]MCW8861887.1 hypothetical protein [Rhodospirillales bacterium]MCW8953046.1 hypothetical protein [Rhodospirillales bacterium]
MGEPTEKEVISIDDADRDSLSVLPLSIIPLQTPALRRARMIKNAHLETVIEFFSDKEGGSGQIPVFEISSALDWPRDNSHPDYKILVKLAALHSYDVYALRISLREMGIKVDDISALKLSDERAAELTTYMTKFTRPLIKQIYGDEALEIENIDGLLGLFRQPDKQKAREKLQQMADALKIEIMDVPRFLEDFGDIFLSLSYYRQCLDEIEPMIVGFIDALDEIRDNWQLKQDRNLMAACDKLEGVFNNLSAQITGRLENFERSTSEMWSELTAERFRQIQKLIQGYHVMIGAVLCALSVKMHAWNRLFPEPGVGGPVKRSDFIMSEIKPGLENIREFNDSTPMLANMDKNDDAASE